MTDRDALLRSVLLHPDDDTPRLVYADWLTEHGEPERAEFIRVQVELARLSRSPCGGYYCDEAIGHVDCEDPTGEKRAAVSKRSHELLEAPSRPSHPAGRHGPANWVEWSPQCLLHLSKSGTSYGQPWSWSRGFVSAVSCDLATFLRVAPDLFGKQPVTEVRIVDQSPDIVHIHDGRERRHIWRRWPEEAEGVGSVPLPGYLPPCLWDCPEIGGIGVSDRMPGPRAFLSREDAEATLSRRCVNYGRSVAAGRDHEVACPACNGEKELLAWPEWDAPTSACNKCRGTGRVRAPGLPPLRVPVQETTT